MQVIGLTTALTVPAAATECVGHRGNSGEELENTYSALESAFATGVPNIELDVRHTRDGVAILSHDEKLRRVATDSPAGRCPVRSAISGLTAAQILDNCRMKNGDEVALLEDVLARFVARATRLFLELKDIPSARTLQLIEEYYADRTDSVRIISKNVDALAGARDYLGSEYRFFHVHRNFKKLSFDFDGILKRKAEPGRVGASTTDAFFTGTYTINDPARMGEYRDAGLSFVISDYPALCLRALSPD